MDSEKLALINSVEKLQRSAERLSEQVAELARELLEIQRKIYFLEVGNEQQKKVHGGTG